MGQAQAGFAAGKVELQQIVGGIMSADLAVDHRLGILVAGKGQVGAQQDFLERAAGAHLSFVEQHQMVGQARHLVRGMADVEHRDVQLLV